MNMRECPNECENSDGKRIGMELVKTEFAAFDWWHCRLCNKRVYQMKSVVAI